LKREKRADTDMHWLLIEEDIMQNKRSLVVVMTLVTLLLFLFSCSQADALGNKEPESPGSLMNQPTKGEPLVPTLEQIQYSFREVAQAVLPVVVEINTIEVITQRIPRTESPWDFFFGPSPGPEGSQERE
jgi:S1-C subfamily serine protease